MGHTPGPWQEDCLADGRHMAQMILENPDWCAVETVGDEGGHVAYCHYSNARLIAAAPELLAALHLASNALDYAQAQVDSERDAVAIRSWRRDVDAAIAKATGKEVIDG